MVKVDNIIEQYLASSDSLNTLKEVFAYINKSKVCNCVNCGAPLFSYKCEYCGTIY